MFDDAPLFKPALPAPAVSRTHAQPNVTRATGRS